MLSVKKMPWTVREQWNGTISLDSSHLASCAIWSLYLKWNLQIAIVPFAWMGCSPLHSFHTTSTALDSRGDNCNMRDKFYKPLTKLDCNSTLFLLAILWLCTDFFPRSAGPPSTRNWKLCNLLTIAVLFIPVPIKGCAYQCISATVVQSCPEIHVTGSISGPKAETTEQLFQIIPLTRLRHFSKEKSNLMLNLMISSIFLKH